MYFYCILSYGTECPQIFMSEISFCSGGTSLKKTDAKKKAAREWLPYAVYRTTGCYSRLGKGYVNHCGPTAITNAILTLRRRAGIETEKRIPNSEDREIFEKVARYGTRHLFYFNFSFLKHYGGTLDVLAGFYLRNMLSRYVPGKVHVSLLRPLSARLMQKELSRGRFLYIQVLRHPKYKNHHFLCYGYRQGPVPKDVRGRKKDNILFICADGWSLAPKELTKKDFRFGSFRSISMEMQHFKKTENTTP